MRLKKVLILFLSLFLLVISFQNNLKAITDSKTVYDDQGEYGWISDVIKEEQVAKGTTYIYDSGKSVRNGTTVDQDLYMLFQDSNAADGVKVVSWGGYNENHTISTALPRMTLDKIAEDYEKNHPGWKVIGGINADQYCWGYGSNPLEGKDLLENRPYYTMIADGENWFSHHFMGANCGNLVGFLNDGSKQLAFDTEATAVDPVFKLNVYDANNNFIKEFNVDELNPQNKVNGEYTYVYALTDKGNNNGSLSRDKESKSVDISSNNDLYIISNADKIWLSNSVDYAYFKNASNSNSRAVNSFFGKGTIDSISKSTTLTATQFAVETTNSELLSFLKEEGCYVVAQYEIGGEYEKCESAIGFHTVQRLNGVDQNVHNSYNTRGYPRSVFGVTSDGKVALITGNGTSKSGFYAQEINAVCKAYNITTAFQMDGGGSVTMILRNSEGGFDVLNSPSDGSSRSIYNGLFFVVKDAEYDVEVEKTSQDQIVLNVDFNDYGVFKNVTKTYMRLQGKTSTGKVIDLTEEIVDGKVSFNNLASNVNYVYKAVFKTSDNDDLQEGYSTGFVKTTKTALEMRFVDMDYVDGELKISILISDPDNSLAGAIKVSFDNGKNYQFIAPNKVSKISDFYGDPLNNLVIEYSYNLNDGKENIDIVCDYIEFKCTPNVYMNSMLYTTNSYLNSCFNIE